MLEQLETDAGVGGHEPSRAAAGLLAVIYGGVLLAGGRCGRSRGCRDHDAPAGERGRR